MRNAFEFIADTWQLLLVLAVGIVLMFGLPALTLAILGGWGK